MASRSSNKSLLWLSALGLGACIGFSSCASLLQTSKYKFSDGVYFTNFLPGSRVFVVNNGDTTVIIPYLPGGAVQDTFHKRFFNATLKKLDKEVKTPVFYESSWDLDVLTILFKYRPAVPGFPNQLNTAYNGALYFGRRTDKYQLKYRRTPIGIFKRDVNHFGISGGVFAGLGATPMNEFVTNPAIDKQYDGLVFTKGLAITGAVQNLSVGLALGFDNLLDENRSVWRYQNRAWIGMTLGINLN